MSKLGNYEMVTCLSENTINGNFDFMFNFLGQIHDAWSCRLTLDGSLEVTEAIIDEGYKPDGDDKFPTYDEMNTKFTAAFRARPENSFMQGFVAQIGSPYISIRRDTSRKVNFHIPFEKGRLESALVTNAVREWNLAGIVYVFEVDLSRIQYSDVTKISDPIAAENLAKYISVATKNTSESTLKKPLTAQDFTLEKLFLNFETATLMADSAWTEYPEGWTKGDKTVWVIFQTLLQNYFAGPDSSFKGSEHPYVLGYGVTAPNLAECDPAIFQPKELDFSTSFVAESGTVQDPDKIKGDGKKCSLNYLMTVKNAPDKKSTATGVMDSLLTEHDLLGIDYGLFYESYLQQVFDIIIGQLNKTVETLNKSKQERSTSGVIIQAKGDEKIQAVGTFKVERDATDELRFHFGNATVHVSSYTKEQSMSGGGMAPSIQTKVYDYRKTIVARPTADLTFPQDEKLHASILRIGLKFLENTDYYYGTKLKAQTTQDGAGLHIDLYPGDKGDMLVRIHPYGESVSPRLTWGDWSAVSTVNGAISGEFYKSLKLPTFLDELKGRLEVGLKSLPKVVLPISNVYTYKSVGYIKHGTDETKSVITFQSTYGLQGPEK